MHSLMSVNQLSQCMNTLVHLIRNFRTNITGLVETDKIYQKFVIFKFSCINKNENSLDRFNECHEINSCYAVKLATPEVSWTLSMFAYL